MDSEELEELKKSLLLDAGRLQQFFSLPVETELGMCSYQLPGGSSGAILSPAHAHKAVYLSPSIKLAPGANIAAVGSFQIITPLRAITLPVQAIEQCAKAGVGWPDTPLVPFTTSLQNTTKSTLRVALRLAPIAELPSLFLLFFLAFVSAGQRMSPAPILFKQEAGRGLCIFGGVVQPTVQPEVSASGRSPGLTAALGRENVRAI